MPVVQYQNPAKSNHKAEVQAATGCLLLAGLLLVLIALMAAAADVNVSAMSVGLENS